MAHRGMLLSCRLALLILSCVLTAISQTIDYRPTGDPYRPNTDMFKMSDITSQGEASYSGDLAISIPLLTVPGMHGHDFPIKLTYSGSVSQRQRASWVGLGWSLDLGSVTRTVIGRSDDQKVGLWNGQHMSTTIDPPCSLVTPGYSGSRAVRINGGYNRLLQQLGVLVSGKTYVFSAWFTGSASGAATLSAIDKNNSNYNHNETVSGNGSWRRIIFQYTVSVSDTMIVQLKGSDGTQVMTFDSVEVYRTDLTNINLVANPSFDQNTFLGKGVPNCWTIGTWQATRPEQWGRLTGQYHGLSKDLADQVDSYSVLIDGAGTEMLPFPSTRTMRDTLNPNMFLPIQWKPWKITAQWNSGDEQIQTFQVTKEDGTRYIFGKMTDAADIAVSAGVDRWQVRADNTWIPQGSIDTLTYPVRWNLTDIVYTDSTSVKISYNKPNYLGGQGGSAGVMYDWDNAYLDRGQIRSSALQNLFGGGQYPYAFGRIVHEYSCPDTLFTDTHYLVFVSSTPTGGTVSDINRVLNQIKLYDRETSTLLKTVSFSYATTNNPNGVDPTPSWSADQKLNDNQLTLLSVTITGSDGNQIPPYQFTYDRNPKMSREFLVTWSATTDSRFPGYFCTAPYGYDDSLVIRWWKLKSIQLPTKATISYTLEADGPVDYDPEGHAWSGSWIKAWSYKMTSKGRLKYKTVTDPFGVTQNWTYNYGLAQFDPPSRLMSNTYTPLMYRTVMYTYPTGFSEEDFYKVFSGCTVGHRWAESVAPDGSTKRTYYTSSYAGPGASVYESQPDSVRIPSDPNWASNSSTLDSTLMRSRSARRGLPWKEVSNQVDSTMYRYSYWEQGLIRDRYEYYAYNGPGQQRHNVELASIWPRLDSIISVKAGVTTTVANYYNPTRREADTGNGLIRRVVESGNTSDRIKETYYAHRSTAAMDSLYMLSEVGSTILKERLGSNETVKGRTDTYWNVASNLYYVPTSTYVLINPGNQMVRVSAQDYDPLSSVHWTEDGYSSLTYYRYGRSTGGGSDGIDSPLLLKGIQPMSFYHDPNDPPQGAPRYQWAYVIAIGQATPTDTLWKKFTYDHFGNVATRVDENGNTTMFNYDGLGRISNIIDPWGRTTHRFNYVWGTMYAPSTVAVTTYRSTGDSTVSSMFYDGTGYEIQRQIAFGSLDIVTPSHYDNMRRPDTLYKVYQTSAASHAYDPSFRQNAISYYSPYGIDQPYARTEYDNQSRPVHQHAPGSVFQNEGGGHFVKNGYGSNTAGDSTSYTSGSLWKSTVEDENGVRSERFTDKLGNTVVVRSDSAHLRLTTLSQYDALGRIVVSTPPRAIGTNYVQNWDFENCDSVATYTPPMWSRSGETVQVVGDPHTGTKAVKVYYQSGTDCSIYQYLGYFSGGKTYTASVWFKSAAGTYGEIFLGARSSSQHALASLNGNGAWQQLTVSVSLSQSDSVFVYLYGNRDYGSPGQSVTYDDVSMEVGSTVSYPQMLSTSYRYDSRGLVLQKNTPDAGSTQYLYDYNSQVRLIKDANHFSTSTNNVSVSATRIGAFNQTGTFTMNLPGRLTFSARLEMIDGGAPSIQLSIKNASGTVTIDSVVSSDEGYNAQHTIILPKGTYSYKATGLSGGEYDYSISCSSGFELVYNKYDALKRLIEVGEYESSTTGSFIQSNADWDNTFPSSGRVLDKVYSYDYAVSDTLARSQHNLRGHLSAAYAYNHGTLGWTTYYSYDSLGRTEWLVQKSVDSKAWKITYSFDRQGNITRKGFIDLYNSAFTLYTFNEYDAANRLSKVYTGTEPSGSGKVQEAKYHYLAGGMPDSVSLGASPAQVVTYAYNSRDWMVKDSSSQFFEHLGYDQMAEIAADAQTGTPQYNGNISWETHSYNGLWFGSGGNAALIVGYTFKYDSTSRLTNADFGACRNTSRDWYTTNAYDMPIIKYDKNGNIDSLQRKGSDGNTMDALKYRYVAQSNRLDYITDGVSSMSYSSDIDNQSSGNYLYDGNGNVIQDAGSGVGFILYGINNLPLQSFKTSGSSYTYLYDVAGNRVYSSGSGQYYVNGADGKTEAVVQKTATQKITHNIWASGLLGQVKRDGSTLTRYYNLKDHLGSIRAIVSSNGTIDSYSDYFPFGQLMDGRSLTGSSDTRYKYTEKERDVETGYDYFGARYYDARIGRWLAVDPLAERWLSLSPYDYVSDNPLRFFDPDGRGIKEFLAKLGEATKVNVSIGIQFGGETSMSGRGVKGEVNLCSTTLAEGDLVSAPKTLVGDAKRGVSLEVGGVGFSVDKTLSETTTTTTHEGIFTNTVASNSMSTTVSANFGPLMIGKETKETRSVNTATGETKTKSETKSSAGAYGLLKITALVGLGIDVTIDPSKLVEAAKALAQ